MPRVDRYRTGIEGWVVEDRRTLKRGDRSGTFEHVAWWYGAGHGWGNTWGPLDGSVAVFDTFGDATSAAASVGLPIGHSKDRDTVIRPVEAAEQGARDRVAARLAEYERDGIPGDPDRAASIIEANRETLARLDEALAVRS